MLKKKGVLFFSIVVIVVVGAVLMMRGKQQQETAAVGQLKEKSALTKQGLQATTPQEALNRLKQGNDRFIAGKSLPADYLQLAKMTEDGQYPAALVLSCIDSRVPPEIIFNQAIGNIFVSRVAAGVLSADVLGGMEYATKVTGSKVIVVLGHENCGAVKGACSKVKLGHLTQLLQKIQPAIEQAEIQMPGKTCDDIAYVNKIAEDNVRYIVAEIPERSAIIREQLTNGEIMIVGAMYHLDNGDVEFLS